MWPSESGFWSPEPSSPWPSSLEHPHFCLAALVCGKCVKLGLILPQGSSPLLLSQAVCLTPFRSAVPKDAWRPDQESNPAENNPITSTQNNHSQDIRSLIHSTVCSRAVPGTCLDFPSKKKLAGSDSSSSGFQCCQCH